MNISEKLLEAPLKTYFLRITSVKILHQTCKWLFHNQGVSDLPGILLKLPKSFKILHNLFSPNGKKFLLSFVPFSTLNNFNDYLFCHNMNFLWPLPHVFYWWCLKTIELELYLLRNLVRQYQFSNILSLLSWHRRKRVVSLSKYSRKSIKTFLFTFFEDVFPSTPPRVAQIEEPSYLSEEFSTELSFNL